MFFLGFTRVKGTFLLNLGIIFGNVTLVVLKQAVTLKKQTKKKTLDDRPTKTFQKNIP